MRKRKNNRDFCREIVKLCEEYKINDFRVNNKQIEIDVMTNVMLTFIYDRETLNIPDEQYYKYMCEKFDKRKSNETNNNN